MYIFLATNKRRQQSVHRNTPSSSSSSSWAATAIECQSTPNNPFSSGPDDYIPGPKRSKKNQQIYLSIVYTDYWERVVFPRRPPTHNTHNDPLSNNKQSKTVDFIFEVAIPRNRSQRLIAGVLGVGGIITKYPVFGECMSRIIPTLRVFRKLHT